MGQVEASATLNAPIESVWACLNDIDHTPEWVVGLEKAELKTPGPYGQGAVYHDINRLGPFRQVTPWVVSTFEPMSLQVHDSTSRVLPSRMTLRLHPVAEGTRLVMAVDYRFLPRLGRLSSWLEVWLMNRLLTRALQQNLHHLGQYVQHRALSAENV